MYCLLGFRCRDDVLIKLWFLGLQLLFFSRYFHVWFHRLRRLLFVVGSLCAALWEESHCIELIKSAPRPMGPKKEGGSQYLLNNKTMEKQLGKMDEIKQKTYSDAEEVWKVGSSSFAAGPSLKRSYQNIKLDQNVWTKCKLSVRFQGQYLQSIVEHWDSWVMGTGICGNKKHSVD